MKKIVLSRFGGIGDVVMLTPILKGIKKIHPDIVLTLVTDKVSTEFAKKFPFVDNVYYYDKTLYSTIYLIKKLWKSDFVFLIDTLYRISVVYALAQIKVRAGLPHKRGIWLTNKLSIEKWMNYAFEPFVYAYLLKFCTGIDVTKLENWDEFYDPEANEEEKNRIDSLLKKANFNDYIVCSLETGVWQKDWLLEYWEDLFVKLKKRNRKVVIIGTKPNRFKDIRLSTNVLDLRGKTNLLELGYIIKKADLLINGCSLPVHIANAFNTPVIGLYGSQPDYRAKPQRIFASICSEAECAPCDFLFDGGHCKEPYCMKSIKPEKVLCKVDEFYKKGKPLGNRCNQFVVVNMYDK